MTTAVVSQICELATCLWTLSTHFTVT